MARRPSDEWQRQVDEQAVELAAGLISEEDAYAVRLWSESLRRSTDAALAAFEAELYAFALPSDEDVLVARLVAARPQSG